MDLLTLWQTLPLRLDHTFITVFGQHLLQFGSDTAGKGFPVRYYGLMYIIGFMVNLTLLKRLCRSGRLDIFESDMENLSLWIIIGILLGGRLGYIFFYNFAYYSRHVSEIFLPYSGGHFTGISGMSFHGAILGGTLLGTLYTLLKRLDWRECANAVFYVVPLGYTFGRFGNFMNGELYGRPTDSALGMFFPDDPKTLRYPSQLFEMLGEGILLFVILHILRRFAPTRNLMMPLYLIGYGIIRFFIEFYREPDAHIMLNSIGLSRGQMLCAAMVVIGAAIIPFFLSRRPSAAARTTSDVNA